MQPSPLSISRRFQYHPFFFLRSVFFHLFIGHTTEACEILVPWPGIQPVTPAVEARSLNHWTAREVQARPFLLQHTAAEPRLSRAPGTPNQQCRQLARKVPAQKLWGLTTPLLGRPHVLTAVSLVPAMSTALSHSCLSLQESNAIKITQNYLNSPASTAMLLASELRKWSLQIKLSLNYT